MKTRSECDYTLRLSWGGRPYKNPRIDKDPLKKFNKLENYKPVEINSSLMFIDYSDVKPKKSTTLTTISRKPLKSTPTRSDTTDIEKHVPNNALFVRQDEADLMGQNCAMTEPLHFPTSYLESPPPVSHLNLEIKNFNSELLINDLQQSFGIDPSSNIKFSHIEHEHLNINPPRTEDEGINYNDVSHVEDEDHYLEGAIQQNQISLQTINNSYNYDPLDFLSYQNTPDINQLFYSIPKELSPLPELLFENPIYLKLLEFYYDKTVNILVPTPELYHNNPFKMLLPRMAFTSPHLLSLLLIYSADHRFCLTGERLSSKLMKSLLSITFSGFLKALTDNETKDGDTTLATAIMLCSRTITFPSIAASSPNIFNVETEDSWKNHLTGAKKIILARGLARRTFSITMLNTDSNVSNDSYNKQQKSNTSNTINSTESDNSYFLIRWLAYIDTLAEMGSRSYSYSSSSNDIELELKTKSNLEYTEANSNDKHVNNNNLISKSYKVLNNMGDINFRYKLSDSKNLCSFTVEADENNNNLTAIPIEATNHNQQQKSSDLLSYQMDVEHESFWNYVQNNQLFDTDGNSYDYELDFDFKHLLSGFSTPIGNNNHHTNINNYSDKFSPISNTSIGLIHDHTTINNNHSDSNFHVDFLTGFDIHMLPLFSQVCDLIKKRGLLRYQEETNILNKDDYFLRLAALQQQASNLKQILIDSHKTSEKRHRLFASHRKLYKFSSPRNSINTEDYYNQLRITNICFCHCALIHLYRRVLDLSKTSPEVQFSSNLIIDSVIGQIPSGSSAEGSLMLPIVTAGCELLDLNKRKTICNRMVGLHKRGMIVASRAVEIMKEVWRTGKLFNDILAEKNMDPLVF